ncbi:MAG: hypothetical protein AB7O52_13855 [Planctomycetota bacterium]
MSSELVQAIRHLQSQKPNESSRSRGPTGSEKVLDQFREGLSAEIQQRIQRTVQRFSRALDDLGVCAPESRGETSLKDTQEIVFSEANRLSGASSPASTGASAAARELQRLHRELIELPGRVAAAVTSSADSGVSGDEPDSREILQAIVQKLGWLEDTARRLEDGLDDFGRGAPATAAADAGSEVATGEALEARLTAALTRLLDERVPAPPPGLDELRQVVAEQLFAMQVDTPASAAPSPPAMPNVEALIDSALQRAAATAVAGVQEKLTAVEGSLDRLCARLDQIETAVTQTVQGQPPLEAPEPSLLATRLEQMEDKVISALAARNTEAESSHALDLTPLVERLAALEFGLQARAAEPSPGAVANEATVTNEAMGPLAEWLERHDSLATTLDSLRRDLSMLVHAVNAHMEQGLERSDAILEELRRRAVEGVAAAGAAGSDTPLVLARLEELSTLPDQLRLLLQPPTSPEAAPSAERSFEAWAERMEQTVVRVSELVALPDQLAENLRQILVDWVPPTAGGPTPDAREGDTPDWVQRMERVLDQLKPLGDLPSQLESRANQWIESWGEARSDARSAQDGGASLPVVDPAALQGLTELPERISEILLAIGEANQHGLTTLVQDSVDHLVGRLEGLLKKR